MTPTKKSAGNVAALRKAFLEKFISAESESNNLTAPVPDKVPSPREPCRLSRGMSLLDEMLREAENGAPEKANSARVSFSAFDETAPMEMGGEVELSFPSGIASSREQVVSRVVNERGGEEDIPSLDRARKLAEMVGRRWHHWLQRKAWDSWVVADIMHQGASQSALTCYAGQPSETQDANIESLRRENEQLKLELRQSRLHQAVQEGEIRRLQQEVVEARMRETEAAKGEMAYAARLKMLLGTLQDVEETLSRATTSAHRQSAVLCILRSILCEKI